MSHLNTNTASAICRRYTNVILNGVGVLHVFDKSFDQRIEIKLSMKGFETYSFN